MAAGLLLELSLKQCFQVRMNLSLISLLSLTWRLLCVSKVLTCLLPSGACRGWLAAGLLPAHAESHGATPYKADVCLMSPAAAIAVAALVIVAVASSAYMLHTAIPANSDAAHSLLQEIVKIMEATAAEGMINETAQWIGILIRGGHARCALTEPDSPPADRTKTVCPRQSPNDIVRSLLLVSHTAF